MIGSHCTPDELYALIDGNLSPLGRAAAAAHIGECSTCASRNRLLMSFDRSVRSLPLEGTDPGFTASLMAKIELTLPAPRSFRLFTWIACQVGLLVTAAVVVGVFVLTGLIQPVQLEAGKGVAGDMLRSLDLIIASGAGLVAGWSRTLIPPVPAGSLTVWSGTAFVILVLVLLDRNFSRKPLHRIR